MSGAPLRIAYVITSLGVGGAEFALVRLLSRLDRAAFQPEVVCLTRYDELAPGLRAQGIPVHTLGMPRGLPGPLSLLRTWAWLRRFRPHLVHTWLYHSDLVGGLTNRFAGRAPLLWHIHNTLLPRESSRLRTQLTVKLCARLSRSLPDHIVCCAEAARRLHAGLGYDAGRMSVLPNGFEVERFRPDPAARAQLRAELGLDDATPLVGMVGRFHPVKDHRTFVEAAARLHAQRPDVHFLLCGWNMRWENETLRGWIEGHGLRAHVHLLAQRDDVPRVYAALDLAANTSITEAFPNVVGEAMASGVACVVTDVGDSALLVGGTGLAVPARDPGALAAAWADVLGRPAAARAALGAAARTRIVEHFELGAIARRFEALYRELIGHVRN